MYLPQESESTQFELCPDGNHLAICDRVIDIGTQESNFDGQAKLQRKVYIGWVIPGETREDGEMFGVGKRYTFSSHEKSSLRKDLESWRGKKFKKEDFGTGGFDIRNLLGKACFLQIVHTDKDDKQYANIQSIASLPKGVTAPGIEVQTTYLSLDPELFDRGVFDGLSERMQETIKASPEWSKLASDRPSSAKPAAEPTASSTAEVEDDDIPF